MAGLDPAIHVLRLIGIAMSGSVSNSNDSKGHGFRRTLAFLIAPLAVPLLLLPWLLSFHLALFWMLAALAISTFFSYAGTLVFGVPAYCLLSARGHTAARIAVLVGFTIGALVWLAFSILFPLSLDQGASGVKSALTDLRMLSGVLWPGGVLGAIVGAVFWLIARPDRQTS